MRYQDSEHQHHKHQVSGRNLGVSIVLNTLITVAQLIGGIVSGSLSLLSDALHNFSDVLSLIISYLANLLSRKKASTARTFGYKRAEIIAAFVNSATLMVISVVLIIEAIKRFLEPQQVVSELVILLSLVGILANGFSVLLLRKDAGVNMNMKSAYLHLLTDMMASIAVLLGGILMKYFQLYWIDPLLTLIIAIYLIYVGYSLLKESTKMLMLFTPKSVTVNEIVSTVTQMDQVKNMHHVHIWQLNEDEVHLEAHIDFENDIKLSEFDIILNKIEEEMSRKYGINHVNIQPEYGKCDSKKIIVQD